MQNTRLVDLLQTFSKKELRDFRKFVASPFYNQRKDVADLLDLVAGRQSSGKPVPPKAVVFEKLYGPAATYDDHKVRMAMSFLMKAAEQFLVHQDFFQEGVAVKTRLAGIYRERNLSKHFDRTIKDARQCLGRSQLRNAHFYHLDHDLQMEEYRFNAAQRRTADHNLQALTDNLDTNYFSRKLRQACLLLSHQAVYKKEYRFGLLDAILLQVEQDSLLGIPAISVYYYCYRSLTQPGEPDYFHQLTRLLVEEGGKFPKNEIADLYLLAINFCIKRYNEGDAAYLSDEFNLYKDGLEKGYLLNNGVLSRFAYRNVVTTGLVLKEYDWVEKFILRFRDNLEKVHRESMFSFSLARLEFERRNFGLALQLLQKSEYRDLLLNLAAKALTLKIYYETNEYDALDSHLDAMQRFLRRKSIMGYHKEHYLNMIQFVRKLLEAVDDRGLAKLKEEIKASKSVAEKRWLLEA